MNDNMVKFLKKAILLLFCLLLLVMYTKHTISNSVTSLLVKYDVEVNIVNNTSSSPFFGGYNTSDIYRSSLNNLKRQSLVSIGYPAVVHWKVQNQYHRSKSLLHSNNTVERNTYGEERNNKTASKVTLQQFGAKGDGVTDDTKAISRALNSSAPLVYAPKTEAYYKVSDLIVVRGVMKKKLIATGAKILNSDLTKASFLFQNSKNIEIEGGKFGYVTMPTANGGNSQHVFQFDGCQAVTVSKVHIMNSPEMGVAITNSNQVTIKNSLIEHTFRDGTYSHYSANVKYISNKYNNIKDDAMSFHDYGIASEKKRLIKFGYSQATNLLAQGNTVENAYQGFGSIGANRVRIVGNRFKNTVLAGIAIFNSKELYPNGTSLATNAQVISNTINGACSTVIINKLPYVNNGQASTGRAAIFIGSLGSNNQLNSGADKRLKNISVRNNSIYSSGAHGLLCNDTDEFLLINNKFINCSGSVPAQSLSGDVIELGNITKFIGDNNTIIDNRTRPLHQHAYALNNVAGQMGKWNVRGVLSGEKLLTSTRSLRPLHRTTQKSKSSLKPKNN